MVTSEIVPNVVIVITVHQNLKQVFGNLDR